MLGAESAVLNHLQQRGEPPHRYSRQIAQVAGVDAHDRYIPAGHPHGGAQKSAVATDAHRQVSLKSGVAVIRDRGDTIQRPRRYQRLQVIVELGVHHHIDVTTLQLLEKRCQSVKIGVLTPAAVYCDDHNRVIKGGYIMVRYWGETPSVMIKGCQIER